MSNRQDNELSLCRLVQVNCKFEPFPVIIYTSSSGGVPVTESVTPSNVVELTNKTMDYTKNTFLNFPVASLTGLSDVLISGVANGQLLRYNASDSKWENVNLAGTGSVTVSYGANTVTINGGASVYGIDGNISLTSPAYAITHTLNIIRNQGGTNTVQLNSGVFAIGTPIIIKNATGGTIGVNPPGSSNFIGASVGVNHSVNSGNSAMFIQTASTEWLVVFG